MIMIIGFLGFTSEYNNGNGISLKLTDKIWTEVSFSPEGGKVRTDPCRLDAYDRYSKFNCSAEWGKAFKTVMLY